MSKDPDQKLIHLKAIRITQNMINSISKKSKKLKISESRFIREAIEAHLKNTSSKQV
jgi:predicted DNA-binding protein